MQKMQLQINSSESGLETQIRERVEALEGYVNGLIGCTGCLEHVRFIVIAKTGRVRIHLEVPGGDLTIDRQNVADLSSAIDEAFAATRIKLEAYVNQLRHDVEPRRLSPDVRVTTIFPPAGYGVLETLDGRQIYFGRSPLSDTPGKAQSVVS